METLNSVVRCNVAGYHVGYTRNTSGICADHSPKEVNFTGYEKNIPAALNALDELTEVFGYPDNNVSATATLKYSHVMSQVKLILQQVTLATTQRLIPTLPEDENARKTASSNARDILLTSLLPYVEDDKLKAKQAYLNLQNNSSYNVSDVVIALSFAFSKIWEYFYHLFRYLYS